MTPKEKIAKSTTDIMLQSPFLARVLLSLPMVEAKPGDMRIPTMATDGRRIIYAPEFVDKLDVDQVSAVRVHECMHVLLGHHLRVQKRDHLRWNIAADFAANPLVLDAGYTLPPGALFDRSLVDLSAEEIYEKLPAPQGQGQANAAAACGLVDPGDGANDPTAAAQAEADWRAMVAATKWGNLPGSLERKLDEVISPKQMLADRLAPMLNEHFPDDYAFNRPNRRGGDVILPKLTGKTGRLAVVVDTSGSVDEHLLGEFWNLVAGLPAIATIDIAFVDAVVAATVEDVASLPQLLEARTRAAGGGGTDFRPGIEWAVGRQPNAIAYLTDGEGTYPEAAPDVPVVWVVKGKAKPPWGEVVWF